MRQHRAADSWRLATALVFAALFLWPGVVFGAEVAEEFRVKREGPFEFAEKPTVTRDGDRVTIRFKTRAFCDVTVAIEDAQGRIIRHLASGVLGENAPPPFQPDSLEQELVWDSKDDQGRYYDDIGNVVIRVSLGLKARFERQFLWSPRRRVSSQGGTFNTHIAPAPFIAQPQGVYVFDGSMFDHLRLFDHQANYVRTVYPFPPDATNDVRGLDTHTFPQTGRELPLKGGNYQSTLLTSGTNRRGSYLNQLFGLAATAMAVRDGRIALVGTHLNRLAADGTTGGLPLEGPETSIRGARIFGATDQPLLPRSAAFSPDGKTLYITGWNRDGWRPNWRLIWVQGVGRIDFENGEKIEPFVGALSDDRGHAGTGPGQFRSPTSVDVDPQGRVYVADRFNDRIQIFAPDGTHLKDIPVPGGDSSLPSEVVVNQRNGDIYVFSWYLGCHAFRQHGFHDRHEKLFHFGPFDNPELKGEFALPIPDQSRRGRYGGDRLQGREFRATINPWADDDAGPHIWIVQDRNHPIRVYRKNHDENKLDLVTAFDRPGHWAGYAKAPLSVRPTTGELYVQRGNHPTVIEPDTGRARTVEIPMEPQSSGIAFDLNGHAYIRTSRVVARFAIGHGDEWREVPFDYGEEIEGRVAAIPIPTASIHPQPAFSVSKQGDVVVGFIYGRIETGDRSQAAQERWDAPTDWAPRLFRGRGGNTVVRVWDRHGQVAREDVAAGVGFLHGAFVDGQGGLYLASEASREGYFDDMSTAMAKINLDSRILSTEAVLPLEQMPDRPVDTHRGFGHRGRSWWLGARWFYGGVGFGGKNNATCHCPNFQVAHDYFARTFVPETRHYSVALLDSAGNLVMRIGQYGSVDDGVPLIEDGPDVPNRRELGGDEVGLLHPLYMATHTDRRLFIADPGNQRIVGVKLDYHTTETVDLVDVVERR